MVTQRVVAGPVITGPAYRVLARASAEARLHGHPYLAPEHILLGLARRPEPPIVAILFNLGISATRLCQTLDDLIGYADAEVIGNPPLTPWARLALEHSRFESVRLGHRFVGPQHLLLGIVHEPATVAAQVLAQFGAGLAEVRREVAQSPVPLRQRIRWRWRSLRPRRRP